AGDVSVQTPLMGTKVVFVAAVSILLTSNPIPISWWVGAFLAFFSVLLLGLPDLLKKNISIASVVLALLSAFCFALADVVVAQKASRFGTEAFIMFMITLNALVSCILIPFFKQG